MGLKYCISSQKFDPMVLEHPKRGPEVVEKTMGLLWNVVEDTITAIPKYNLFGTARGKQLGVPLVDMTEQQVLQQDISRLTLLRLAAQTYDKLAYILGPLMLACKVLSSRACELATLKEMEMSPKDCDPGFVRLFQTSSCV